MTIPVKLTYILSIITVLALLFAFTVMPTFGNKSDSNEHVYDDGIVIIDNCCSVKVKRFTCVICGYFYDEESISDEHTYGKYIIHNDELTRECTACGSKESIHIDSPATSLTDKSTGMTCTPIGQTILPDSAVFAATPVAINTEELLSAASLINVNGEIAGVFDLSLQYSGTEVSFDGTVNISIPIDSDNENDTFALLHIDENEAIHEVPIIYADGLVTFTANHLSLYALIKVSSELVIVDGSIQHNGNYHIYFICAIVAVMIITMISIIVARKNIRK